MILIIFSLVCGFFCLWKGGDWLVDGASEIGHRLNISPMVLGLTLIAFGTSAPELIVSLIASFQSKPDIIIGNILGSNIANTCLILGITGAICPIILSKKSIKTELFINLAVTSVLLLFVVVLTPLYISSVAGVVLIVIFLFFLKQLISQDAPVKESMLVLTHVPEKPRSFFQSIVWVSLGCTLLPLGGHLVVNSAILSAQILNISESLISLIVVAIGTSLPELFACLSAARKKESEMALGSIIGSNIFNISLILSVSSFVSPIAFGEPLIVDLSLLFGLSVVLLSVLIFKPQHRLSRQQSVGLIIIYALYIFMVVGRG